MKRMLTALAAFGAMTAMASAEISEQTFKVIGTWNTGSMYKDYEAPMWNKEVPEASGGKIKAEVQSVSELGLSGSEFIKLLSSGAFDAGFMLYAYIVSGDPVFEGLDLSFVPTNAAELKEITDAHGPVVKKAMEDIHGIKVLVNYPFPLTVIACREEFKGLSDLKGRKIRVFSTTLGDMVEGLGGVPITIPFAEVPTALQRGVIDCGVASAIAMYNSKWFDVVDYVYEMPAGAGMAFLGMTKARWDSLDPETQKLLQDEADQFAQQTWDLTESDEQQGFACLTGETLGGPACQHGDPVDMTLVRMNEADQPVRKKVLEDFVLKRFSDRCGPECTAKWNETAGKLVGIEAKP